MVPESILIAAQVPGCVTVYELEARTAVVTDDGRVVEVGEHFAGPVVDIRGIIADDS